MNQKEIIGEKIVLRPITMADTDLIVTWRNNPLVRKNFIFREPFTSELHNNWMRTKVATGQVIQYIIVEKGSGLPVGSVYFRDIDAQTQSAEFGIFIGEDSARGKGIGSETVELFSRYGIEMLHFRQIRLRLLERNEQAYRTYRNAGFEDDEIPSERVLLDGEYHNVIFMSMRRGDTV